MCIFVGKYAGSGPLCGPAECKCPIFKFSLIFFQTKIAAASPAIHLLTEWLRLGDVELRWPINVPQNQT